MNSAQQQQRTVLTAADIAEFSSLNSTRVVRDTLLLWAQIVAAWFLAAYVGELWVALLLMPWIGTRYYALFIIGHDGLHRRLFQSLERNDLWNDLFVLGPIGAITRLNRHNHMTHHRRLATDEDPDRYKYLRIGRQSKIQVILHLSGLGFVRRSLANVFSGNASTRTTAAASEKYSLRDVAILVGWQAALLGGLTAVFGWWGYFVLWALPVYAFTFCADVLRVFLEHSSLGDDAAADEDGRLVNFHAPFLERVFFAPMSMNLHATHHLWPQFPYYNLGRATERHYERGGDVERRSSYVGYWLRFIRPLPWWPKHSMLRDELRS